jgi:hypothetical protein
MSDYETRTTRLVVLRQGAELFDESATTVEIEDESGGEFIIVSQSHMDKHSTLRVEPGEWPRLREAIDKMVAECRG